MKKAVIALCVLLALGAALGAAGKEERISAAGRAEKLRGGLGSFCLTLEYFGEFDPKGPRWGLTLSTRAVPRGSVIPFHTDVVVDEGQAGKVIDRLGKDGFFERGTEAFAKPPTGPCYILRLDGGAPCIEDLGWGDALVERLDSLRSALDGDAAKKMDQFLAVVKELKAKSAGTDPPQ